MKEEKLLRAIGGIDDDLIDSAMAAKKKTHPAWVRWAAVAACLCLLVASPVGAAMGESLEKFINNSGHMEFFTSERLNTMELSPEALAAFPEEEGQTNYITLDSEADAEAFLGIELPDNPVLQASTWDELHWETASGEVLDSHCIVTLSTGDKPEPYCADAELAYRIDGVPISVMYRHATEKNPYDNAAGVSFDSEKFEGTEYTAANGRIWNLYLREYEDGGAGAFALSKVNGTLTWIQVFHTSIYTTVSGLESMMIEIMEAYE